MATVVKIDRQSGSITFFQYQSQMKSHSPMIIGRLVLAFALVTISSAHAGGCKPDIVYIIADDLGWKDVGFHGSDIRTTKLDKLTPRGVALEQFYSQPVCTQTRAALLTRQHPFRYGFQFNDDLVTQAHPR
jgi:hypothetical protein